MREDEAVLLDNIFPEESRVRVRRGHAQHTTGLSDPVESLLPYAGPASQKLYAAYGGEIHEVTNSGAAQAADYSSLTNDRWQHTMFGNSAGNYLYIVNGDDAPRYYDGSSWTIPTITGSGLTASNLIHINSYKKRLFLIEKDDLGFWYFPSVELIAGAVSHFPLGSLCEHGGYVMAMGTWSRDGGEGLDDIAVFITSEGEMIVFQGDDPGDPDSWLLVGTYYVGVPIGRRCLIDWGGDLIVITEDGFVPVSRAVNAVDREDIAISDKINGAVNTAARTHKTKFGWQPILHPGGNMAIFNIPIVEGVTSHQYVMNTKTRAWCRFTGMDALCWAVFNGSLYYGGSGTIEVADTGEADNGEDITADAEPAFSYFRGRGVRKALAMARPNLETIGTANIVLEARVDFEDRIPTSAPSFTEDEGEEWDLATWDVAEWSGGVNIQNDWKKVSGVGVAVTARMQTATRGELKWTSTDWLYEIASPV